MKNNRIASIRLTENKTRIVHLLIDLENRKSDTNAIAAYHFSLDANGNRVQIDETAPITWTVSSGTLDYTYNDMKNRLLTAGSLSFAYDIEGQLAGLDGSTYAFDYEHRLKNISGSDSIQYTYDGSGNRLEAVRDGVITCYIYDAAGNLLAEADGSNNITRYYIHGLGLLAMVTPADEVYYYHFDAIGSTIAMTDETQALVNTYAYTPFGSIANEYETLPQPFKYVGQHGVMAEPNGFYYMRARYYDPEVGRFISEDPIGFAGGDVNLYAYVGNNPMLFVDPWGEFLASGTAALVLYVGVPVATRFGPVIYRAAQSAYLQYIPAATRLVKHYYDYEGPEGPSYYSRGLEIVRETHNRVTDSNIPTLHNERLQQNQQTPLNISRQQNFSGK